LSPPTRLRSEEDGLLEDSAIKEFLRDDYARLVNMVALVSGDPPGAEDAVQEALVRAWTRSERGERIDSLANWVAAVALNLARSRWRRLIAERRAKQRLFEAQAISDLSPADRVDVWRALAALPRRQREVAVLRYFLQMSTNEVAATLHVSDGTVKNSLAKARRTLAASLRLDDLEDNDALA
jgi:RNA polymerase sigma-70 factor (ECF subfamily)